MTTTTAIVFALTTNSTLTPLSNASTSAEQPVAETTSILRLTIVGLILTLIIILTAIGNILVIAAVVREKQLNSTANKLVASLAFTDFVIGVLVMPLSAAYLLVRSWMFGWLLCDIYVILDVLCCTASILHLVAIAIDRYWSITDVRYTRGSLKHRYFLPAAIAGTWLLSAAICLPPFFGWRTEQLVNTCIISQDKIYTIYSTFGAFYAPLIAIVVIYVKIFRVVKARVRRSSFRRARAWTPSTASTIDREESKPHIPNSDTCTTMETTLSNSQSVDLTRKNVYSTDTQQLRDDDDDPFCDSDAAKVSYKNHSAIHSLLKSVPILTAIKRPSSSQSRDKLAAKREKRALRTLLILTGVFITCWLPFFIFAILVPFCGSNCNIPDDAIYFVTWLGYFNSMINPVIYTIFSPDFRNAFKKLLCWNFVPNS